MGSFFPAGSAGFLPQRRGGEGGRGGGGVVVVKGVSASGALRL